MLSRLRPHAFRARPVRSLRHASIEHRPTIPSPRPGSGPLMERRADRALPSISTTSFRWLRTLPIFGALMVASALAIFNYQKQSSSVVSSTLYALRTSPRAREILGDEVYFASKFPWISGELNQMHGRIDISFWVKGTRGRGVMRFKSERKTRMGYVWNNSCVIWSEPLLTVVGQFETLEWSLQPEGGEKISLMDEQKGDLLERETTPTPA